MDVQRRRDGRLDRIEEFAELEGTMPLMTLPDDLAALDLQRGEQRRGAVT